MADKTVGYCYSRPHNKQDYVTYYDVFCIQLRPYQSLPACVQTYSCRKTPQHTQAVARAMKCEKLAVSSQTAYTAAHGSRLEDSATVSSIHIVPSI
jgi:hypothetical protein